MPIEDGKKTYNLDGKRIIVDQEFKDLLDPLSPQELADLEANLIADGRCFDPLIIWAEENILLDGHNRIRICTERDINYKVLRVNLPDREAAIKWVVDHQMGKRNLSEAGKQKARAMRRERVAKSAGEGKSVRTIAKEEKVSTSTVLKDIDKSGVSGVTPDKIKGADGKKYPSREERLGLNHTPPKPRLKRGERTIGGDEEAEKAEAKDKKTRPKQGHAKFDWKPFEKHFAKLMLMPDLIGKAYGAHNSAEAKAIRQELLEWKKKFKTWAQMISKVSPPAEPHEK